MTTMSKEHVAWWQGRFVVVRDGVYWKIKTGTGTRLIGKFLSKHHAETIAAEFQTAFNDGYYCAFKVAGGRYS